MSSKESKKIRDRYKLMKEIEENPDWCYCERLLCLDPDVDFENDEIIGMTDPIDGYPHPESKGYTIPLYVCKRCGKKVGLSAVY